MSKQDTGDNEFDAKDERKAKKKDKVTIQTKVIIRRLPPGFNETQFLEVFGSLPENDFFRFVTGDRTLAPFNYCRAYINFLNVDDILTFRDKFDGLELEKNGQKYHCVVEYAAFQKIPRRNRRKDDVKMNTIEQDPDYIKFLESLEAEEEKETLDVEQYLDELESREKKNEMVDTPLTSFIKQRREERKRIRDERRKLDLEKRKKKEEERRRRREAERKKRLEAGKIKKNEPSAARAEYDGKKTLAETRPVSAKKETESNNNVDDDNKVKILQKEELDGRASPKKLHSGVFSSRELELSWSSESRRNEKPQHQPAANMVASEHAKDESKFKGARDTARKWKGDPNADVKVAISKSVDAEPRYKTKRSERGGSASGTGGGRGRGAPHRQNRSLPQKYSEQRNRSNKQRNESAGDTK